MALEKLKIYAEKARVGDFAEVIEVLFNPEQIVIQKTGWKEDRKAERFVSADQPATLTIDLFFDTTLINLQPKTVHNYTETERSSKNVQKYTQLIYNLTKPRGNLGRPPRCQLIWGTIGGKNSVLLSDGFLQQVTKTLTHFWEDGTPVRARLNCTFQEWTETVKQKKILNPIDDPIRIVKRGETLSSIATQEYNDPSLWRVIAEVNRIDNPRNLKPGTVLTVPPLRSATITGRR